MSDWSWCRIAKRTICHGDGLIPLALLSTLVLTPSPALAQSPPDAGRVLEETRPAPSIPARPDLGLKIEGRPAMQAPDGVRFKVTRLGVTGATMFDSATLHALVQNGEGRDLDLAELNSLAQRITSHYRAQGYLLARAYIPAQEIKDGVVEIAVLEGRLGEVRVNDTANLKGAALSSLNLLAPGETVRAGLLEKSLLLAADTPGVEIKSTLKPGAVPGASDLLVDVSPGRRVTGSVEFDTYGNRFTGANRLGGSFNLNNPLQLGDQASLRAIASDEEMTFLRASYQLPINAMGTRLGGAYSDMRYELGEDFTILNADGKAQVSSLFLLHPFARSRQFNLYGQLQYDHKKVEDRVNSTATITDKELDNATVGINGDLHDGFGGGGANSFSLTYLNGDVSLDTVSEALDAASAQSNGSFGKWNASFMRLQRLTDQASLYLAASGQLASKNLDSVEKFSLGGAYGVRAYPQGEAAGDQGYLVTLEARHNLPLPLPGLWQATAFMDSGHVRLNKDPWMAGDNGRTLTGAGFGLNVSQPENWNIKASLAWKVGSEEPTSDVDRNPRGWVQAVKYF